MIFSRDSKKKNQGDISAMVAEIHRLHGAFIDEFRACTDHLKRSANDSLKAIKDASAHTDELAEVAKARAEQINNLAADVDRFEARISKVESQLANLRASILSSG